jgi:hypothetical protein
MPRSGKHRLLPALRAAAAPQRSRAASALRAARLPPRALRGPAAFASSARLGRASALRSASALLLATIARMPLPPVEGVPQLLLHCGGSVLGREVFTFAAH